MRELAASEFADRRAAGRALAAALSDLAGANPVVIGLVRGGVPVAYEVARALHAPLDVLVVRKIGAPGNPEYGIGAIAEGGIRVLNQEALRHLMISVDELELGVARARREVDQRVERYRSGRPPLDVRGRTTIVVDDGLATGGTARAALRALRERDPARLVLAVPVGSPDVVRTLRSEADEVRCVLQPDPMWAVGFWYEHFEPTTDAEIVELLAGQVADPPPARPSAREIRIPTAGIVGDLIVPGEPGGLVVFAHGSGSGRHSPRNRLVARALGARGLATLLLDLLRADEEVDRANVFDIELLAERLVAATRWLQQQPDTAGLLCGYFGASTGAAAALAAAAELGGEIAAIVSRGGRPDLAGPRLPTVSAPVLLIVGGADEIVLELNRAAMTRISAPCELAVVEGATHLFEEPGALEQVSRLAGDWFERHLSRSEAA